MGSGKSTIGLSLAKALNYSFIDLDILIQKEEKKSIETIFTNNGEAHFRKLESKYLRSLSNKSNTVIALGGGTPCHNDNMKWINAHGLSIYLNVSEDTLFHRLKNVKNERPLLKGFDDKRLKKYITLKIAERLPYYSQAKFTVNGNDNCLDAIKDIINQNN